MPAPNRTAIDTAIRIAAIALLMLAHMALVRDTGPGEGDGDASRRADKDKASWQATDPGSTLYAGYAGLPIYHRSDLHFKRRGGTDVLLKQLGWDGDAFYFPLDGGVRSVTWWSNAGFMIDFLHNKAIARLGRGAHGRKLSDPVVEEVEASGTIDGKPAPAKVKLTDVFDRFEFTHGHNMLFFTGLVRPLSFTPRIVPYFGIGGGFALPHVESWKFSDPREDRTSEYQLAGPAAQAVAGIELRSGRVSYFVEYKFSLAWISGMLTGDESWMNFNMPGDLLRQFKRWVRSEPPRIGSFSTTLAAHQVVGGVGYWARPRAN